MSEEIRFKELNKINCKVEKKGRFNYISWASAWKELKSMYPSATFTNYQFDKVIKKGDVTQKTSSFVSPEGFVRVGVTVNGVEHVEDYPVLNNLNKPIPDPDSFEINKSLKRALAKAIALHGIGLYVFEGEDLPEDKDEK